MEVESFASPLDGHNTVLQRSLGDNDDDHAYIPVRCDLALGCTGVLARTVRNLFQFQPSAAHLTRNLRIHFIMDTHEILRQCHRPNLCPRPSLCRSPSQAVREAERGPSGTGRHLLLGSGLALPRLGRWTELNLGSLLIRRETRLHHVMRRRSRLRSCAPSAPAEDPAFGPSSFHGRWSSVPQAPQSSASSWYLGSLCFLLSQDALDDGHFCKLVRGSSA